MAPRSSNRSVYLPDDLWAWLDGETDICGLSVNGQVRVAVQEHRRNAEHLKQVAAAPPKSSTPSASLTVDRGPPYADLTAVVFGPVKGSPGSRLKKVKGA